MAENIKNAQEEQRRGYNAKFACGVEVEIGQSVFVINKRRQERKGGKQQLPKCGPYTVIDIDDRRQVSLKNAKGDILKTKYSLHRITPVIREKDMSEELETKNKVFK